MSSYYGDVYFPPGQTTPGPAGHTTPAPAGSVTPAPPGHFTPGPAGYFTPGPGGFFTPGPGGNMPVDPATLPMPVHAAAGRIPGAPATNSWAFTSGRILNAVA